MAIFLMSVYTVNYKGTIVRSSPGRLVVDVTRADAVRLRRVQNLIQIDVAVMYDALRMGFVEKGELLKHDPELWGMTEDTAYCELPGEAGVRLYAKSIAANAWGVPMALTPLGVSAVGAVWLAGDGEGHGLHFQFPDGRRTPSISWRNIGLAGPRDRGVRA